MAPEPAADVPAVAVGVVATPRASSFEATHELGSQRTCRRAGQQGSSWRKRLLSLCSVLGSFQGLGSGCEETDAREEKVVKEKKVNDSSMRVTSRKKKNKKTQKNPKLLFLLLQNLSPPRKQKPSPIAHSLSLLFFQTEEKKREREGKNAGKS